MDFCAFPGARSPTGLQLPPNLPYLWVGESTTSWAGTGFFIKVELEPCIRQIVDLGNERILWLEVWNDSARQGHPEVVLASAYPAPGGDVATWQKLLDEARVLQDRWPGAKMCILCDGNVRLSYLAEHDEHCMCLHCHQTRNDRIIEEMLEQCGWLARTPPTATHSSGSCLDLIITPRQSDVSVSVVPDRVALSDHKLVVGDLFCNLVHKRSRCVGRITWAGREEWDVALQSCQGFLEHAAKIIEEMLTVCSLRPPAMG